jgi:outer membrane protein OmpA-like peptidoglycan-associated protein
MMTFKSYLSVFIVLLCPLSNMITAQVSKGWKHFEKKEYVEAQNAFARDLNDGKMAAVANFGLAKSMLMPKDMSYDSAMMALGYLQTAETMYKAADAKTKASYSEEKLTADGISTQKKTALTKAWEACAREANPNEYDPKDYTRLDTLTALDFFKRNSNAKAREDRKAIIAQAWPMRNDYASISNMIRFHEAFLPSDKLGNPAERVWQAFMRESGPEQLDAFKKAHPAHWASKDCALDAAAKAFKSEKAEDKVAFFMTNPSSCIAPDVMSNWLGRGDAAAIRASLQSADAKYGAAFDGYQKIYGVYSRLLGGQMVDEPEVVTQVKAAAPSRFAWATLQMAFNQYLAKKQYDQARTLVRDTKALFPNIEPKNCDCAHYDYTTWFDQIGKVLEGNETGSGAQKIDAVNTAGAESRATPGGGYLYFTGDQRPDGVEKDDPFRVPLSKNGVKGKPEAVSPFADRQYESIQSITADGSEALVTVDGELYYFALQTKGHYKRMQFDSMFAEVSSIGRASISPSGELLAFDGKAAGSNNLDIFVCQRKADGGWTAPVALPKPANTSQTEKSPYVHADGKTIYFASDGQIGLGGMDLYMTRRLDDTWLNWSDPVNLGKQINSTGDDSNGFFSVANNGATGYFARGEGSGKSDIYSVALPERARAEASVATVVQTNTPGQQFNLNDRGGLVLKTVKSNAKGTMNIVAPEEYELLIITPKADTVFAVPLFVQFANLNDNPANIDSLRVNSMAQLFTSQEPIRLPDPFFVRGQSDLQPDAQLLLERYYKLISKRKARVTIIGHTDNMSGSNLGKDRAEAVKGNLVSLGYDETLITAEGGGSSTPVAPNDTEANRSKNRRVEIRLERGPK